MKPLPSSAGTTIYPASLLSTAPLPDLLAAVQQASSAMQDDAPLLIKAADGLDRRKGRQSCIHEGHAGRAPPLQISNNSVSSHEGGLTSSTITTASCLLALEQFSCSIGGSLAVVTNLDLFLKSGEHVLILGASGAGKSTLVRALAELLPSTAKSRQITRQVTLRLR